LVGRVRLIAWNCHHGWLSSRLAELAPFAPALVFLQEYRSVEALPLMNGFVTQRVNAQKCIALGSLNSVYPLAELKPQAGCGRAVVGATIAAPIPFTALGIWSQGPRYVDDVMKTLDAYSSALRSGPAVVMGDLNSGTNLAGKKSTNRGHSRIVHALADIGLVSAYHAFHRVEHGDETHPTYHHQRKPSQPWHIDFCFVPACWAANLVSVEILDGKRWATRSDHLPLKVDIRFTARPR
jgi:endonuclease/exonuclease/phosphatase family protein